jgi:RHS repeat-associated protein
MAYSSAPLAGGDLLVETQQEVTPFSISTRPGTDPVLPPAGSQERVRFAGKEHDAETGGGAWQALDYFGARYLHSASGRFTSVDPVFLVDRGIADPQSWNRYAYVRNNPARFVDPDGRVFWFFAVALGVAYVLNNPTVANTTTGPTTATIVPNSVLTAGAIGAHRGLLGAAEAAVKRTDDLLPEMMQLNRPVLAPEGHRTAHRCPQAMRWTTLGLSSVQATRTRAVDDLYPTVERVKFGSQTVISRNRTIMPRAGHT